MATHTPTRKLQLDAFAIVVLVACCAFWGGQQVLVKATLPELPPIFQTAVRFIGATVLVIVWARCRGVELFSRDATLVPGLIAGGLFALEFALMYIGLQWTTASRLTLFLYTAPFTVALLVPRFIPAERLNAKQWMGLICAFCAVALVLRESLSGSTALSVTTWRGDVLALLAGIGWGLTTVVIRVSALAKSSAEKILFYQIGVSAVTLSALSFAMGEPWTWRMSPFAVSSLLIQTVLGAFASFLIWMAMLRTYPATKLSSLTFLAPIFAMLFGAMWLREPLSLTLLVGVALVTVGIVLVNRR